MQITFVLALAFLAPAFAVAGLVLAGLPILIHLLNRRRYKIVDWAAMDFLLRAMRKNRRRVRFEQWLLLATRCLLLAFLGLALSRPLGCNDSSAAAAFGGGRTGLHVFVIDNAFPMAYHPPGRTGGRSHLEQAKVIAGAILDRLNSGGESVAVITAGRPANGSTTARPTYDLSAARGIVNRVPQTYAASDMAAALRLAADLGRTEDRQPNKYLYVLTDATAAAWQSGDPAALKSVGPELAKTYRAVTVSNLSRGPQWNQAVTDVRPSAGLVTTNATFAADFAAAVRGFGAAHDATLQWKVDGKLMAGGGPLTPTASTPMQSESQDKVSAALRSGGPHVVTATLVGGNDPLPADDGRARVVNVVAGLKALIVEGQHAVGAEGGSGLNLEVALAGVAQGGRSDGFVTPDLISDLELGSRVLTDYRAVILCSVSQVTPAQADQLAAFVQAGGTLMVWLGDNVSDANYNAVMAPRHLIPGPLTKRVTAPETSAGFTFDFNPNGVLHPLLRAFEHQENTGLETATAFGYWQCDAPVDSATRVLNWKDSGTPGKPDAAITSTPLGRGRVVFVSTAANYPWITFFRKPVYTELVNELLHGSVNAGDAWMNLTAGDRLLVPASVKLTTTPTLTDPAGVAVPLEPTGATDGSAAYRSPPVPAPGLYQLSTGTGPTPIAVTVPPEAADVRTVDNAAVRTALGGADVTFADDAPPAAGAEASATAALDHGWTVMLLVLILVGFEAFLAMRFGHPQAGLTAERRSAKMRHNAPLFWRSPRGPGQTVSVLQTKVYNLPTGRYPVRRPRHSPLSRNCLRAPSRTTFTLVATAIHTTRTSPWRWSHCPVARTGR